ncbi:MAG: PQQ-dependent sugar dehydrogenase [Nitrospiria bacterium]
MRYQAIFFLQILLVLLVSHAEGKSSSHLRTPEANINHPKIRLEQLVDGMNQPLTLVHAGDRLFIVEQPGIIRVMKNGLLSKKPFLDIRNRVVSGGEKGLLGLAFHPNFLKNGRLFVNYTESTRPFLGALQTVIAEYRTDKRGLFVDMKSERRLLTIPQPFGNHNGGQIAFGPDGMLYIGTGDGGAGNDPNGNGQNLSSLLGKILRINVDQAKGEKGYRIPTDNPFTIQKKIAPEIWAYGLRNPWRFSFDAKTGALYLADVGQNHREEINIIKKGQNYGWNIMEGTICTPRVNARCNKSRFSLPLFDYPRSEGTVVIGGYVYRGKAIPKLRGAYVYGDFGNGRIWMLRHQGQKVTDQRLLLETGRMISAFGEDAQHELYIVDYAGKIFKINPE